ncbi:MAG: ShlB/FhaC/HecB family hemolysin secretion/activation protein [Verrucomicrobiales bacterium]
MPGSAVRMVLAGLLSVAIAAGQDVGRLTPGTTFIDPVPHEDELLIREIHNVEDIAAGEIFLDRLSGLVVTLEDGKPRYVEGGAVILSGKFRHPAGLKAALSGFIGKPLTASTFPAVAETIVRHFDRFDRPVVEVSFPEQDITDGVLRVDIVEGRFGKLGVTGTVNWNIENLTQQLSLPEIVSRAAILQELDWINENRLRRASASVSEGVDGETDVEFRLNGERAWRAFAGYENSGASLVGEDRYFVGFDAGDLFHQGHQLTYQCFTDDSLTRFQAHALSYRLPLSSLRHVVTLSAAVVESEVALDGAGGLRRSDGSSWLTSASYKIPLRRYQNLKHSVAMGLEFKSSNNNFEFGGGEALDTSAEVIQAGLAYSGEIRSSIGNASFDLGLTWSPGGLSDRNSDDAFAMLRPGAQSDYVIGTAEIEVTRALGAGFEMSVEARGQWSAGTTLIPSEQLALGGYDGVRGYEERETLGDAGFIVSSEIYTPVLQTGSAATRGLIFLDYGVACDEFENDSEEMASYGAGLRLQIAEKTAVRFDYGWQGETGEGRGHIGLVVEF